MLKVFQKFNYNSLIILFFVIILLWLSSFLKMTPFDLYDQKIYSPLFRFFAYLFSFNYKNLVLLSFIIFIFQVIYITYISNKFKLFEQDTFMVSYIFILLSGYFFVQKFSPVFIANIFLLLALDIFIQTNQEKQSLKKFLTASILLAIASLVYFPYIFFLIFALIAVIIIRSRITKEFFLVIFGFFVSYLFFFEINYLIFLQKPNLDILWESLGINGLKYHNNLYEKIYFSFIIFIFIIANMHITQTMRTKKIELRTIYQLLFFLFIFSLILFIIVPSLNSSFLITIFIPLSFLFSNYFINIKINRINNFIFFLFIIAPFVFQLGILF